MEDNFYYIGEVASKLGIHEQTIRTYEKKNLIAPKRSQKNTRLFTEQDILRLTNIVTLTEEFRLNLVGVKLVYILKEELDMSEDEFWDFIQDNRNNILIYKK